MRGRLEQLLGAAPGGAGPPTGTPVPREAVKPRAGAEPQAGDGRGGAGRGAGPPGLGARGAAFAREHLLAVVGIALVACVFAGYSMVQARTLPVAAASPTVSLSAARPSASQSPPPLLLVHVLGAVARPGVVRVPQGARVQDAIEAAGGMLGSARPGQLNLAAVVADGSQIVIGTAETPGGEVRGAAAQAGAGAAPAGAGGTVNLNTATEAQLDALPGVGPVTASAIVAWRTKHGKFTRVEELSEVDGIGPKTYAQLAPKVTV